VRVIKGDLVKIIAGDDRGKTGRVLKIQASENKILIEGVHFIKRHTRRIRQDQQGGILEKEAPIDASNVRIVCPKCGKITSAGKRILASGKRVRTCKQCGEILDKV
jgi:large subunit ribosomal protein L24